MTVLALLTSNPETLGLLAVLLAASLFVTVGSRAARTLVIGTPAGLRPVARHHIGAPVIPPRMSDPAAKGHPRPRAPSTPA
ncbi:hypothetical protein [Sciscionella sediminilitoris]|uniref:hypothetical protein n=1 Tax=Sciscionella sediminilitoris TaxID=1445613 RepID=UPI0004DF2352|nr:hypothetical protein [Sciscionella sp. SE31]